MKPEEQPCEFPACAVHHICENPCKRNRTETLAKALHDMADVDFDNVFLRSAAHLRALDASHQRLKEALNECMSAVEVFHGPIAWDIDCEHSPEMKR